MSEEKLSYTLVELGNEIYGELDSVISFLENQKVKFPKAIKMEIVSIDDILNLEVTEKNADKELRLLEEEIFQAQEKLEKLLKERAMALSVSAIDPELSEHELKCVDKSYYRDVLSDSKIRVDDNELNRLVQKTAFSLGWSWRTGGQTIRLNPLGEYDKFMYFRSNKVITMGGDEKGFNSHTFKEITPADLGLNITHSKK